MKFTTSLSVLLLSGGFGYASSLAVYQDHTFYSFTPKNNFIGFSKALKAKCEGTTVPISMMSSCPPDDRLCKLLTNLKHSEQKIQAVQENAKALTQLISLPQPTTFDAAVFIEAAKYIGTEQARLLTQEKLLREEVQIKQRKFQKQAPTKQALETTQTCSKEVELTIPYGYVSFATEYEANIEDEKEVTVTQYLSITNRSGIDIEADSAMFYYRSANQYVHPTHFRPWIVSKYEPRPQRVSKKSMAKSVRMDMAMMGEQSIPRPMAVSAPVASYEDAREYKIEKLLLPSTGVPLDVNVLTWKTALSCEVRAYPYADTKAFHVCSFEPKHQIDSNRWKVKSADEVINENAAGEYRDGKYNLYTKVEEDIKIERKAIVNKERETGIFGGTARKKDGFTLTITNKSDKAKTFKLIERIPTSTTEEIKSKLLSINSEKKVNYKLLKDGQIEMKLVLAPHESKKIEVLFEISYDKDLKVNY
ncbi:MAG: DUF4139 domain-containing protein [Sulfurovum sp.]|uniref:DUF4139 domain-containing protein n=1 Tax=Sulfurovum sp. TaxID=1969726 RepID=UPI002867B710|nr:DUF4139 domain-containing protein [Sulfurovum sp.]MCO4846230.1 DUF4139 domain-containing protein [Sulfurovum sp.]